MSTRIRRILSATATLALVLGLAGAVSAAPAQAAEICERYGSMRVDGGRYIVQNNQWGADVGQCIDVDGTSFVVTGAGHSQGTNGAPGAYPSIFRGCHYSNCTTASGLPAQVTSLGALPSAVQTTTPQTGSWNAAYDLWLDPSPRTDGQNTGAEIMIWIERNGPPRPVGTQVGTVTLAGATWEVWFGNIGWNVVSYVRTQGTESFSGNLRDFIDDAAARGHVQRAWYLTSVQFGFEPWEGGPGLAVDSFSVDTGGGTPGSTTTSTTTSPTSTTSTTTSTTSTTVPPGGATSCRATTDVHRWQGGFVANVTVHNTGSRAVDGWTARFSLPGDAQVAHSWNADVDQSGRAVSAVNATYNGSIAPGASISFGFLGTVGTGDARPLGITFNGQACTGT